MICRAARLSENLPDLDLVCCCECGSANLVLCDTSGYRQEGRSRVPTISPRTGEVWDDFMTSASASLANWHATE